MTKVLLLFFLLLSCISRVERFTQREQKEVNYVFWVSEGVFQRWIGSDQVFKEHRIVTITSGVRCQGQRSFGDISVYDVREMGSDMEHSLIVVLIENFDLDMKQEVEVEFDVDPGSAKVWHTIRC